MRKILLSRALDMLQILGENEYSALWDLVDDFEVNGHIISVKGSSQFKHVIIDNRYVRIGGDCILYDGASKYEKPLDYVKVLLEK